jgi:hypothetical protein
MGHTYPENVQVTIRACLKAGQWCAILESATGNYSIDTQLLSTQTEVTGPGGNTIQSTFCDQVTQLNQLEHGSCPNARWWMQAATVAHENVHATHFQPAFVDPSVVPVLQAAIEGLCVPDASGMTSDSAVTMIQCLPAYSAALTAAQQNWLTKIKVLAAHDHDPGGATDQAAYSVVNPMIQTICNAAKANGWGACAACPIELD